MDKTKLTKLLKVFTPDETAIDFTSFESEMKKLEASLKEKVQATTLNDVNSVLEKQSKKINFEPLIKAFDQLKADLVDKNTQVNQTLVSTLEDKQTELAGLIKQSGEEAGKSNESFKTEFDSLNAEIAVLSARKVEIPDFGKQIKDTESKLTAIIQNAKDMDSLQDEVEKGEVQKQFMAFEKQIKELKRSSGRGGSMNRQIFIGGVDPLTRYTDINLKAGTNVTLTYANNNQTKKVDITIASSGGGGGSTRSINSVSVDTTAGSTSGTDYVYLVSGTTTITLPTAVGNTNLYTIKNVGTGVVTVATTSAQTIDGATTQVMPVQFTSIDVISDTANWSIT